MIIALVFGATLWIVPGTTLRLLGWVEEMVPLPGTEVSIPGTTFVDDVLTRLLGAALLAFAFRLSAGELSIGNKSRPSFNWSWSSLLQVRSAHW
jgi:hypothetical protein